MHLAANNVARRLAIGWMKLRLVSSSISNDRRTGSTVAIIVGCPPHSQFMSRSTANRSELPRFEQALSFVERNRVIDIEPEPVLNVESTCLVPSRQHIHSAGNAVVSPRLAFFQRVENDRGAQKNARIEGVKVANYFADMLDSTVGTFDARDVLRVIERTVDIEIDTQGDGVRLERCGHQAAEDFRIDQVIAHRQQERLVQIPFRLEQRDSVGTVPLIIDDVRDANFFSCGKCIEFPPQFLSAIAADNDKFVDAGAASTADHTLYERDPLNADQRLEFTLLSQPGALPGRPDKTFHRTAAIFTVLERMKASTI